MIYLCLQELYLEKACRVNFNHSEATCTRIGNSSHYLKDRLILNGWIFQLCLTKENKTKLRLRRSSDLGLRKLRLSHKRQFHNSLSVIDHNMLNDEYAVYYSLSNFFKDSSSCELQGTNVVTANDVKRWVSQIKVASLLTFWERIKNQQQKNNLCPTAHLNSIHGTFILTICSAKFPCVRMSSFCSLLLDWPPSFLLLNRLQY